MSFKSADNNQRLKGTFYLSGSILHVKCRAILRLALAPVVEAGSGDVRVVRATPGPWQCRPRLIVRSCPPSRRSEPESRCFLSVLVRLFFTGQKRGALRSFPAAPVGDALRMLDLQWHTTSAQPTPMIRSHARPRERPINGMSVGASVPEMVEPIRARSDNTLHSDAEFGSVGPSRVPNR